MDHTLASLEWEGGGQVLVVGLMGWVNPSCLILHRPYGMVSGGQEEPFSRLALAV